MKLHVHITLEDYIQFNIFHIFHSNAYKKQRILGRIRYFILLPLLLVFPYLSGVRAETMAALIVFTLVYSTGWFFLYPKFVRRNIRKNINKLTKSGKLPFPEDAELCFGEETIVDTSATSIHTYAYSSIEGIHKTEHAIYLSIGAMQAIILPIRDIESDKAALLALLNEKCSHLPQ